MGGLDSGAAGSVYLIMSVFLTHDAAELKVGTSQRILTREH